MEAAPQINTSQTLGEMRKVQRQFPKKPGERYFSARSTRFSCDYCDELLFIPWQFLSKLEGSLVVKIAGIDGNYRASGGLRRWERNLICTKLHFLL